MIEWRNIENNSNYLISNDGLVKNVKTNEILKSNCNRKGGYKKVNIGGKTKYIHRLVAIAFIPNPNNYPVVNHIDENTLNNDIKNLEWCTQKHNCNHGNRNKKILENNEKRKNGIERYYKYEYVKTKHGAWNTKNKTSSKKVICVNNGVIYNSLTEASFITGVAYQNISSCCRGKLDSAGKDKDNNFLVWKYYN